MAGADPKTAFAKDGLLDELKKAFAERALNAEIDHHLNNGEEDGRPNSRNGYGRKSVLTETAKIELEVPRDRLSTFDPQLIAKYQRRFPGFDEKIVSMYARGMSVREIQGHLRDLYGVDVSADLVSAVTDAVLEEIAEWQNRPLEPLYALVFFDATLVTSNLPFDEWTSIFGSERLTGALLDRLTHHVHILEMNGESYRLATSKKAHRRPPQPRGVPAKSVGGSSKARIRAVTRSGAAYCRMLACMSVQDDLRRSCGHD